MSRPVFKPDLRAAPWLTVAERARSNWGSVTPFRLGRAMVELGLDLRCPYTLTRSINLFLQGARIGRAAKEFGAAT